MKRIAVIIIFVALLSKVFGQEYFIKGNIALENSEFQKADSLLTISIEKLETPDAYFNRAIARLGIADYEGSCSDWYIMDNVFNDIKSAQLFNLRCCSLVDTSYLNSRFEIVDSSKFKYYKVKRILIYSCDTLITYYKKNGNFGNQAIIEVEEEFRSFKTRKNNKYAQSFMLNGTEVYTYIYNRYPVLISEHLGMYELEIEVKNYVLAKYPQLKMIDGQESASIEIEFIVSPEGEIIEIFSCLLLSDQDLGIQVNKFMKDLDEYIARAPKLRPIRFSKIPIHFQFGIEVKF